MFLQLHQCPSRLMTVFLGTTWSSIKQIKAPYVFDGEHGIPVHIMQGNWASSPSEGEVSWFYSRCGGNLGYILKLRQGWPFKLMFVQRCQDSCLVMRDSSAIYSRLSIAIVMLLEVRRETQGFFLVATVILGFISIFNKSQASSIFEALNSTCLVMCQRAVKLNVQLRLGPRAFSKISTTDLVIPSSCVMKDNPIIKPLQGNPAFFQVRASWCPFHLSQQTHGPSHIHIAEGILLLRYLWKVGIPLQSKPENQLSSRDDMGSMELSSSCYAEIGVTLDLSRVSQGISGVA